ncbi:MAG TPA: rRNA cytosine-C5-methyltransferase, partial [Thermomonospora sp.]|nr:rRNA cytosine-C5-methyltransferase [Thermomonospora sp.]
AWLDLCAGPGGKAGVLSALAARRDARLLACDVQPHRAALVRRAVDDRTGVAVVDGTVPAWRPGAFDRVLLDAPCTGLGALRRRPEARWRRQPSSVAELGPLQRALLGSALDAVRPGGVVAYVTCSPHLAETRVVVDDVLRRRDDVERLDSPAVLAEVAAGDLGGLGGGPYAQFWPHRHGTDAMFLALLRRTG